MICSHAIPVPIRIETPRTQDQASIASCALTLLGVPFRLNGHSVETGLDCVGVVLCCLGKSAQYLPVPANYRVRGSYEDLALAFFDEAMFTLVDDASWVAGDILLLRPGCRQMHFAVLTLHGAVHAHMGLGRVVLTPLPLPYGKIAQWRFRGD